MWETRDVGRRVRQHRNQPAIRMSKDLRRNLSNRILSGQSQWLAAVEVPMVQHPDRIAEGVPCNTLSTWLGHPKQQRKPLP